VIDAPAAAVNFLLQCNPYAEIPLIHKGLLIFCIATKECVVIAKGGPMIGIAVVFLVSTIVLMTLSAIEG
jgi:hypothetical protein